MQKPPPPHSWRSLAVLVCLHSLAPATLAVPTLGYIAAVKFARSMHLTTVLLGGYLSRAAALPPSQTHLPRHTRYNTVQLDWINEMLLACKEFEDAERDRINFLKSLMSEYAAEGRKVSAGRLAAFDAMEAGYARVDPMQDIFAWTADACTGTDRPRPFPYMTPAVIEDGYERQLTESAAKGKK